MVQLVKSRPAVQETRVQSLGQDDPLEREITTHSSSLASRIPWTAEPGGLQSIRSPRVSFMVLSTSLSSVRKKRRIDSGHLWEILLAV